MVEHATEDFSDRPIDWFEDIMKERARAEFGDGVSEFEIEKMQLAELRRLQTIYAWSQPILEFQTTLPAEKTIFGLN